VAAAVVVEEEVLLADVVALMASAVREATAVAVTAVLHRSCRAEGMSNTSSVTLCKS
jgi:hypothetical protein